MPYQSRAIYGAFVLLVVCVPVSDAQSEKLASELFAKKTVEEKSNLLSNHSEAELSAPSEARTKGISSSSIWLVCI